MARIYGPLLAFNLQKDSPIGVGKLEALGDNAVSDQAASYIDSLGYRWIEFGGLLPSKRKLEESWIPMKYS